MTPYGDIDLGQHWRHQAITWTNVDLSSVRSSYINLKPNSQEIHKSPMTKINIEIARLKCHQSPATATELNVPGGNW